MQPDLLSCKFTLHIPAAHRTIVLQNHSTCFGCPPHPSSGVLKTVTAASGTGHNIGTATSVQRGQVPTWPRWRVRLQFLVLLMMGAVDTGNMQSDSAVK